MNRVAAFALRRKNSILSMSEKMFCPPQPLRFWIHPRVCGEKLFQSPLLRLPLGSPSRVRGKAVQFHHRHNGVGITPACAGKSHVLPRPAQVQWDHPRVCGEKKKAEEMGATTKGSPPRMRGKENRVLGGILHVRITPACAGKSRRCRPATLIRRDHPRVCGEKSTEGAGTAPLKGSPPRVRGKGDWTTDHPGQTRITPACAGKSGRESGTRACCRDRPPHVRGKAVAA